MKKLINANHIKFFKEVFDVDVTNVEVIDEKIEDEGTIGLYKRNCNSVVIDTGKIKERYSSVPNLMIATTVVHELTHYCQRVLNRSLILPINGLFTGDKYALAYSEHNQYEHPLEIDARIMEAYYLFFLDIEDDLVTQYGKAMLSNIDRDTLYEYIKRLNNNKFYNLITV